LAYHAALHFRVSDRDDSGMAREASQVIGKSQNWRAIVSEFPIVSRWVLFDKRNYSMSQFGAVLTRLKGLTARTKEDDEHVIHDT